MRRLRRHCQSRVALHCEPRADQLAYESLACKALDARQQHTGPVAPERLREIAYGTANLMYSILEATRVYATLGEMTQVLREEWGEYTEPATF